MLNLSEIKMYSNVTFRLYDKHDSVFFILLTTGIRSWLC